MKIIKIEVKHLKIPLKKPYVLQKNYGSIPNTVSIIIKIHTDEGIWGVGECNPQPPFTEESADTVKAMLGKYLGPCVLGMDPTNIGKIIKSTDSIVKGNNLAKAAIDVACHDIFGKAVGVPIHRLLGGNLYEKLPIMNALGNDSPEVNAEEALVMKKQGYSSLMIKVGALDIFYDADRVRAIRSAVGDNFPLIVDANQGWDFNSSVKFLRLVHDCNILLFLSSLFLTGILNH